MPFDRHLGLEMASGRSSKYSESGKKWNHKKVYRVYKAMHYEKRSKLKKRLPARVKTPLETPEEPNTTWSIDFVSDAVECGRKFRVLNIIDIQRPHESLDNMTPIEYRMNKAV
jgi:transposase InsO family protein